MHFQHPLRNARITLRPDRTLALLLTLIVSATQVLAQDTGNSSALHQRIKAGRYRVVGLVPAPEGEVQGGKEPVTAPNLIATLRAAGPEPQAQYNLTIPKAVAEGTQLKKNSMVVIKHRIYGLLFSHEDRGNLPFYLLLDTEWEKTNAWKRVEKAL